MKKSKFTEQQIAFALRQVSLAKLVRGSLSGKKSRTRMLRELLSKRFLTNA